MDSVLVTGANGFVGRHMCTSLRDSGVKVRAVVRQADALRTLPQGIDSVAIDTTSIEDWTDVVSGIDQIVHLIGMTHDTAVSRAGCVESFREVNVGLTRMLLTAADRSGVSRFLYVSSIKALSHTSPAGAPMDEDSSERPTDAYGQTKREAEEEIIRLSETACFDYTIVRSPLVYGPGGIGNLQRLIRLVDSGVPLPIASVHNLRSIVYVSNLASAILAVLSDARGRDQVFHVADSMAVSTQDLVRFIARALGKPSRLFAAPHALLDLAGKLTGRAAEVDKLTGTLQMSTDRIDKTIGWKPPVRTEQGIAETVAWYLNGS